MDRLTLSAELAVAFAAVKRDPGQSIHQAQLCDSGMSDNPTTAAEWCRAGKNDTEVAWQDVPGTSLDECDYALSHFTPESWRFYLPAYMQRSLFHFTPPDVDSDMLRSVIFSLTLKDTNDRYHLGRYKLLSCEQHRAATHFLQLVEREALMLVEASNSYWWIFEDANSALQSYWLRNET